MKIELDYPYNQDWKHGYVVGTAKRRKTVVLYNGEGCERSSTSYARYLMSTYLGRYLKDDEHVDHIDNNMLNDVLENLQILTLAENNRKEAKRKGKLLVEIICPQCSSIFTRRRGNTQAVPCNRGRVSCCSRECSYKFTKNGFTEQDRMLISERSLLGKVHKFD